MLHTSLRVIHQTDRFTVTKFTDGVSVALVIEALDRKTHDTIAVRAFSHDAATIALANMAQNAKATFEPGREFTTDDILQSYFSL